MLMTLRTLEARFPTEDSCKQYLAERRWPDGSVRCPRCNNDRVYKISQPWKWQCKGCAKNGYRFSVTTGTVFEDTKYPLRTWFKVAFLMLTAKKGMSALQVQRTLGSSLTMGKGSYETFWYLCHRLRAAMQNPEFQKLTGEVEMDETFIGGKFHNQPKAKRRARKESGIGGRHFSRMEKAKVIGAISRKGNVVCKVIENLEYETIKGFVQETISDRVSLVSTDEGSHYSYLDETRTIDGVLGQPPIKHGRVNHSRGQYVRGNVHTNSIEGFWSLIKRGVVGSFHNVSHKYLPLYLNEFTFRHNERKDALWSQFDTMMSFA